MTEYRGQRILHPDECQLDLNARMVLGQHINVAPGCTRVQPPGQANRRGASSTYQKSPFKALQLVSRALVVPQPTGRAPIRPQGAPSG